MSEISESLSLSLLSLSLSFSSSLERFFLSSGKLISSCLISGLSSVLSMLTLSMVLLLFSDLTFSEVMEFLSSFRGGFPAALLLLLSSPAWLPWVFRSVAGLTTAFVFSFTLSSTKPGFKKQVKLLTVDTFVPYDDLLSSNNFHIKGRRLLKLNCSHFCDNP